MQRFIKASTNEGDVVLDPFCGCGTTIAGAADTNRRWVGVDIAPFAIKLVRDRRVRPSGHDATIRGIPTDVEGARMLLERNPFDFEAWIVTAIPGMAPNERETGDRGIDGRGAMMPAPQGEHSRLVLAQVKGGGYSASGMRDFQRVIAREEAAAGPSVSIPRSSRSAPADRAPSRRSNRRSSRRVSASGPPRNDGSRRTTGTRPSASSRPPSRRRPGR